MKIIKLIRQNILGIVIGAVVFGSVGVYAGTLMNSNEVAFTPKNNKWNVTKVDEALNSLYSVAVPEEYTGTTEITPTYSDITLNTQDKLLKNNITISGIPSTYKNLTNTTTVTADKLASGETAYNSDGNLITGIAIIGANCIVGTYSKPANSQWNINIGFKPSKFLAIYSLISTKNVHVSYIDTMGLTAYQSYPSTAAGKYINSPINLSSTNTTFITNLSSSDASYKEAYEVSYVACK